MKIFSWNVNGLGPTVRNINLTHGSLKAFFEHLGADVVCFQEAKIPDEKLSAELACVDGYESFWACCKTKKGYSGVTTYVSLQHSAKEAEVDGLGREADDPLGSEGRIVLTDLGQLVVVNVYVPNAGERPARPRLPFKMAFLAALQERLCRLQAEGRPYLLVGDLNVPATRQDVARSITWDGLYSQQELEALHSMLQAGTDLWRRSHPDALDVFTVWDERTNARLSNRGLRIDYAVCSPDLLPKVEACEILGDMPPKWSDHAPLLVTLHSIPPHDPWPPCALSSRSDPRFAPDRQQPRISSWFSRSNGPRPHAATTREAAGVAPASEASSPDKPGSSAEPRCRQDEAQRATPGALAPAPKKRKKAPGTTLAVAKPHSTAPPGGQRTLQSFFNPNSRTLQKH